MRLPTAYARRLGLVVPLSFVLLLVSEAAADEFGDGGDRTEAAKRLGESLESSAITVQIVEDVQRLAWPADSNHVTTEFTRPVFALMSLPHKYSHRAVRIDRSQIFVVRLTGKILLPPGRHTFLLRSMNSARVLIDNQPLAQTRFIRPNPDGHEAVPDVPQAHVPRMRRLPVGHAEEQFVFQTSGGTHEVVVESLVGGKKLRPELGELSLSMQRGDQMFYLLSPHPDHRLPLTDEGWLRYVQMSRSWLTRENQQRRRIMGEKEDAYWQVRHERAREFIKSKAPRQIPSATDGYAANNSIDHFVNRLLADQNLRPKPLTSDLAFLRRVTLDTVGVIPTVQEVETFLADDESVRRQNVIERLISDARWADHWVAYWQDVLAENPGILKPKINNTGPFRFWIHESFFDNKPIDRFVTELVMMYGSKYQGGPAGFGLATQNDVPLAAKAQIVAQAFLAVDMKCARCHDAPFQDVQQRDLFALAAMLKREPQQVPDTSSIPLPEDEIEQLAVEVTLAPGSSVEPAWPFLELQQSDLSDELLRDPSDSRERLAALITSHQNQRFAPVVVNRLWQRYLGRGLVDAVDDWDLANPTHPDLLAYLADELILHGYDLKHVARLIFNSHTYQRQPAAGEDARWFSGPARRRLTAEQIVDSLFSLSGKPVGSEPLTLDLDGRRDITAFLNLGVPTRAWEFTSLSNERDRPALAMPMAQSVVDVLESFGWRSSRQNPLTIRPEEPTIQQPAILANGVLSRRICGLSDDSGLTTLCLQAINVDELVEGLFLRTLTRAPSMFERYAFVELLQPGFDERVVDSDTDSHRTSPTPHAVSWSNHLSAEATRIKLEMERLARAGDPPTRRLTAKWRERAEDAIWALTNTPEFVFAP